MYKEIKVSLIIIVVVLLTIATAHAQRKFSGKVVDVIDGRTCVIQLAGGRVTAVLEYVEIPDADQPISAMLKSHLSTILLGKNVDFSPRIVMPDRTVGQLIAGGVDVSEQLLRDGAAWYAVPEKAGHAAARRAVYEQNESQAKAEKRGVWGVPGLRPPWEIKAEQELVARQAAIQAIEKQRLEALWENGEKRQPTAASRPAAATQNRDNVWASIFDENAIDQPLGLGGLRQHYEASSAVGWVRTPMIFVDIPKLDMVKPVVVVGMYIYVGDKKAPVDANYFVVVGTVTKQARTGAMKTLTIVSDGRPVELKSIYQAAEPRQEGVLSVQVFQVTREQLEKIGRADKFGVNLGGKSANAGAESPMYFLNLANAT